MMNIKYHSNVTSLIIVALIANTIRLSVVEAATERPHVIIVMTDDQGYGEFSCHGNPITQTPNIDQLASESVRLTDFHVSPMCTPTRGQLMTGLDAFRNSAINVSSGRTLLKADLKTIANHFQDAGYRTGIFGKWHLGDNYPFRPEDRGFEETLWFPSSHINSVPDYWNNDYFDDTYMHNGKREKFSGYCTDIFFNEAYRWMSNKDERPFFMYIALNAAHSPWFVPEKYREPLRQAVEENIDIVKNLNEQKQADLISFLAMGANIDENIGKMDEYLREHSLFENTIVVFLTDNGSTMGEDYYNAGMRGKKTQLWEGGHRVPCFIRWPDGNVGGGRDITALTHVQDLLPTLADLANVSIGSRKLDGETLAPLLRGEKNVVDDRMLVINYSRMPGFKVKYTKKNPSIPRRDGAAVLWKQWRLLENRMLYNVEEDPLQHKDVTSQHPEIFEKMSTHLDQWWDTVKDDVAVPQRVVIGNDAENPILLTACEWLDVFVDQQKQVRRGDLKNGVWHLDVATTGEYRIELRRWPRESNLPLTADTPETKVTDGTFITGRNLPVTSAQLKIGKNIYTLSPEPDGQSIVTILNLIKGPIEMKATFLNKSGNEICGAYYNYIERQ